MKKIYLKISFKSVQNIIEWVGECDQTENFIQMFDERNTIEEGFFKNLDDFDIFKYLFI